MGQKDVTIYPHERLDDLQCRGYAVIQDPSRFCFGVDAVLLAHYAKVKKNDRVLDLGTGTGIIPILLHALTLDASQNKSYVKDITGLEIQSESAEMAARSVEYNGIESQVNIVQGDIKEAAQIFDAASFQVVTCNPPYTVCERALANAQKPMDIARHEVLCTLADVVSAASKLLVTGGRFYLVHKPFRLPEIISVMKQYKIEPKQMRLVHPYVDKEPTMVLIGGVRGGKPELRIAPPLVLYREKGIYTDEVQTLYHPK